MPGFSVTGGHARGSPHGKAVGNHLLASAIPFQVSQDAVGGHRYELQEVAECRLGAPRGDRRPERSAIQRPSAGGYLLLLFASELAIGQSSTEPIRRPPEASSGGHLGIPLTRVRLGGRARGGLEPAMNPP